MSRSHQAQARIQLHAAQMRAWMTPSEARLWSAISHRKLGVQFRKQVVVGSRFIVDFLAAEARLALEVDGGWHTRRLCADARRDEKLRRLGYRVLRLRAKLVLADLPGALARIAEELAGKQ